MKKNILLLAVLLSFSCSESLPPRNDPVNVLSPAIRAQYSLTSASNGIGVTCKLTNILDETLQGNLSLSGEVEITWARFPEVKKTATLDSRNLSFARNYNGITGELTIDPGDSITVTCFWSVMADSEAALRNQIFLLSRDMNCLGVLRSIAEPETFFVTGDVRVFRNTAPVKMGQTEVSFCLVTTYVDTRTCNPIATDPPCGAGRGR